MNSTLVLNPKGGSGKTTIAVSLAAALAAEAPTTLMDYDPQGSSLAWLRSRSPQLPRIHAANGAPERYGRLRSFDMYVPPETRHLVIDAPAGAGGLLLNEMLRRAHRVLVPIVPSLLDIRATEAFLHELAAAPRVRSGEVTLGIVANKVRISMPAYPPLVRFLESLGLRLVARLLDSDAFVRVAETGVGILEMDAGQTAAERRQFTPLLAWVLGEAVPVEDDAHEVRQIRRVGA